MAATAVAALQEINDSAVELALLRLCTNVCKADHLLRAAGPALPLCELEELDSVVDFGLSVTLGGTVSGLALERATRDMQPLFGHVDHTGP